MFKDGDEVIFINDGPINRNGTIYNLNMGNPKKKIGKKYTVVSTNPNSCFIKIEGDKYYSFSQRYLSLEDYKLSQIDMRKKKMEKICSRLVT